MAAVTPVAANVETMFWWALTLLYAPMAEKAWPEAADNCATTRLKAVVAALTLPLILSTTAVAVPPATVTAVAFAGFWLWAVTVLFDALTPLAVEPVAPDAVAVTLVVAETAA